MTYQQVTKDELERMNDAEVVARYQSLIDALVLEIGEDDLPSSLKNLRTPDLARNQLEERLLMGQEQYLLAKNPEALAEKLREWGKQHSGIILATN
jgi:hypothetical protein